MILVLMKFIMNIKSKFADKVKAVGELLTAKRFFVVTSKDDISDKSFVVGYLRWCVDELRKMGYYVHLEIVDEEYNTLINDEG